MLALVTLNADPSSEMGPLEVTLMWLCIMATAAASLN